MPEAAKLTEKVDLKKLDELKVTNSVAVVDKKDASDDKSSI